MHKLWMELSMAIVLANGLVYAEKWDFLGKHELGSMYLDMDSVQYEKELVQYWVKRHYFNVQKTEKNVSFDEQHMKHQVDCRKKTVMFTDMVFYYQGKQVERSEKLQIGPKPIEPNGFIQKEASRLCPALAEVPMKTGTIKFKN